jgi:hypothetical protein
VTNIKVKRGKRRRKYRIKKRKKEKDTDAGTRRRRPKMMRSSEPDEARPILETGAGQSVYQQ